MKPRMVRCAFFYLGSLLAGPGLRGEAAHAQSASDPARLCLDPVYERNLPDFEPLGLRVSGEPDPAITTWSRSSVLVMRVSPSMPGVESMVDVPVPEGVDPLGASLTAWNDGEPVVELLDAQTGAVWTVSSATGKATRAGNPGAATPVSAVMRVGSGWVYAERIVDPGPDTVAIVIRQHGDRRHLERGAPADDTPGSHRTVDRMLHLRPDAAGNVLVKEASFPFTTIAFTSAGLELRRDAPRPDDLRDLLGESDLRYIVATPAIAVDEAVLNTFVALRSGRRITALRLPGQPVHRYREVPGDLAFLGALPTHRLLVGTRDGEHHKLLQLYRWRWIDQRRSCT